MEKKNRPKLASPQERLDLILLGLARGKSVEVLCQEAGVSRELFYRWMRRVRTGALNALETQKPGPKRVKNMEQAAQKIQRMQERVSHLEQRAKSLRKEHHHLTLVNREAVTFLCDCEINGIKLKSCPLYIRNWIDQEKRRNRKRRIKFPTES